MMRPEDLPEKKLLIQIAEEGAELSKAALKVVRAMEGDTPVPEAEARKNLIEEMADVMLTIRIEARNSRQMIRAKQRKTFFIRIHLHFDGFMIA